MDDLFSAPGTLRDGPLADRMRPQTLDEVIGQDHIVGPGRLLRRAIQADRLSSVIFYGPPGTGKTSLARVIANTTKSTFESLNAVLSGVKDIREAIGRADERRRLYGKRTILFVDEVHRWNKAQQDALLPWVENGTVILVGATTENPFFEVNRALVSRSRIFQLKSLVPEDLKKAALRTLADRDRGYGKWKVLFEEGALEHLVEVSGGDVRSLLNALELAVETSRDGKNWPPPEHTEIAITLEAAEESIQRRAVLYDRDGDYHFDTISAFIKSVRGSDPDAALYWLAKMVRAGEDPAFIFRRMIILASEDVGMADPSALPVVIACAESFDRIGFPEGNFPLAHACLYLATAPKSNSAMAFFDALAEVDKEDAEVPSHLRDASRDAEGFGHGEGYIYPHAYRDHWAAQQYLPDALRGKTFYMPSALGYEGRIRNEVLRKREIQAAIVLGGQSAAGDEILSWSPSAKGREGWFKRLESGRSALLLADRDALLDRLDLRRHSRVLVPGAEDGLLLWEGLRRVPEGLCAALVSSPEAREALERFAAVLEDMEKPAIAAAPGTVLPTPAEAGQWFGTAEFDGIVLREPFRRGVAASAEGLSALAEGAAALLARGGRLSLLASPPSLGQRISRILEEPEQAEGKAARVVSGPAARPLSAKLAAALLSALSGAEEAFFADPRVEWGWTAGMLEQAFIRRGFSVETALLDRKEERLITEKDLSLWFNPEKSAWGRAMAASLGEQNFGELQKALAERTRRGPVSWTWKSLLMKAAGPG
ncbi:MAG: AAA family ATPase [Spirochaetaceae bacterium]|jgi:putative ATPase|nr:AAA family ATPase [Spirochaetaceae bacterium]